MVFERLFLIFCRFFASFWCLFSHFLCLFSIFLCLFRRLFCDFYVPNYPSPTDDQFEEWLKDLKLIPTRRFCDCGGEMSYKKKKDRKYPLWRCSSLKNHDGKQVTVGFFFFEKLWTQTR